MTTSSSWSQPEGKNKSTAIMVLAGKQNFSDQTILGVEDRVAQELMTGVWLYEIADLTDIAKADVNRVKAFASRDTDRARPVYARVVEKRPRRCTLWATTNDQLYLKSQTGNRRFCRCRSGASTSTRCVAIATCCGPRPPSPRRPANQSCWTSCSWATAAEEQEKRRTIDPWEDILANIPEDIDLGEDRGVQQIIHVKEPDEERVASSDLLTYVLRVQPAQQTTVHGQRLAVIMERLGWKRTENGTLRIANRAVRGYWRPIEQGACRASRAERTFPI